MQQTENIGQLAAALAKAQGAMVNPTRNREVEVKTSKGYTYKFKYATLDAIMDSARKPLSENGLCFVQVVGQDDAGRYRLSTRLIHESGEWLVSETPLMVAEQGAQAFGSALTYARRYALTALLGIAADEDDDGNAADGNTATPKGKVSKGQQAAPPPATAPIARPQSSASPHDPETGEIGPHAISVPADPTNTAAWVGWGGSFVKGIVSATAGPELEAWVTANVGALAACAKHAGPVYNRIHQRLQEQRQRLTPVEDVFGLQPLPEDAPS